MPTILPSPPSVRRPAQFRDEHALTATVDVFRVHYLPFPHTTHARTRGLHAHTSGDQRSPRPPCHLPRGGAQRDPLCDGDQYLRQRRAGRGRLFTGTNKLVGKDSICEFDDRDTASRYHAPQPGAKWSIGEDGGRPRTAATTVSRKDRPCLHAAKLSVSGTRLCGRAQ